MKRLHALSCVALLLAGVGAAAPGSSAAAPKPQATLKVNGLDAVGSLGDSFLSLKEAISLANGTLTEKQLSDGEHGQVTGHPGRASRDLIQVTLPRGTVISSPTTDRESSAVGRIIGNTGDTLDGGGAMLVGDGVTGAGLILSSSDFTLRNIGIKAFNEGLLVDFGGLDLHSITVSHVEVRPGAFNAFVVGARSSHGHLKQMTITDSVFDAGAAVANAANISATHMFLGGSITDTLVEEVLFAGNEVIGGLEGFYVYGAEANGGTADHAYARHIRVLNNYFHDNRDAAMNIDGATGIAGRITDSGVDGVEMAGNRISGVNWGIGVWGGEAFGGNVIQHAFARNLSIHDNRVTGVGTSTNCIILEGGRVDATGVTTDSDITNVRIINNKATSCTLTGIALHGAVTVGGGLVTRSGIRNVLVSGNAVKNAVTGLIVRGAYPGPASVTADNGVTNLRVLNNSIIGGTIGMRFVGADSTPSSISTGNQVSSVVLKGNSIRGATTRCVSVADAGVGAIGNTNTARCPG